MSEPDEDDPNRGGTWPPRGGTPSLDAVVDPLNSPRSPTHGSAIQPDANAIDARLIRAWNTVRVKVGAWVRHSAAPDGPKLKSLASQYDEAQHKTYLDHLEDAVKDPRNRNIAVSGRYGTGKSSVLDKFEANHKRYTLRLAVSTLGPEGDETTLTNRIQKEVLKQLVYSARPKTVRHSRFRQRVPLTRAGAFAQSLLAVVIFGILLWLLRHLPTQIADGAGYSWKQRDAVWAVVAVLLASVLAIVRMVTYNRFVVSGMSAAGATLSLTKPENTYFDEHLDEIVYFFNQESTDFVIFEDVDRYNDPQIFEALRELNTLLNNTPKRRRRIARYQQPLRFVYAMRDSLFQAIGDDIAKEAGDDAARAENIRANRTKFFEVVIPLVPFISHRTAREHLDVLLRDAGIDIDRSLIEVVAKHVTDMRLLLNICNEYIVFSQRLLESGHVAPNLEPSKLFALVAYKNFHLADFERIPQRGSDLDRVYDFYRQVVSVSVSQRERSKRQLLEDNAPPPAIHALAKRLGERLIALGHAARDTLAPQVKNATDLSFQLNSDQNEASAAITPAFWDKVVETRSVALASVPKPGQPYGPTAHMTLSQQRLEGLFPEALAGRWQERNAAAAQRTVDLFDREIEVLRGADFQGLFNDARYKAPVVNGGEPITFEEFVSTNLKSDLAKDLVAQGHIDQNFTLYAAQFYGNFTGVKVATFMVQVVQANRMDIGYTFEGHDSIANLLNESDSNFLRTVSAYNIEILDYLLVNDVDRADDVIDQMTRKFGDSARKFAAAYFTTGQQRTALASRMAGLGWDNVFTYLSTNDGVPADVRPSLVSAALLASDPGITYELSNEFVVFVLDRYQEMSAFTERQEPSAVNTLVEILRRADIRVPSLDGIDEQLKMVVVERNLYELTADNLRSVLGLSGEVSLDQVRANAYAYKYCLDQLGLYLDVVEADGATEASVRTTETLIDVLEALEDDAFIDRFVKTASQEACLIRMSDAPSHAWGALARANLVRPTLVNLEAYRTEIGEIDANFGQLLIAAGTIDTDRAENPGTDDLNKVAAAIAVLNAAAAIPDPRDRVRLTRSLELDQLLSVTEIAVESNELIGLLIEHGLVSDDATTFTHLRSGGWAAIEPAIIASTHISEFLTPNLVEGSIAQILQSSRTSGKVGETIVADLASFVPENNSESLLAAARFAIRTDRVLPVDQIQRIAAVCRDQQLTVQLLAKAEPPRV